jgi:multiple sugar transport system ATP-binding protein
MAEVSLHKLNKKFDLSHVVKDVDLRIRDKEFMVFVGPSGCGKTTTLRMIAGLEAVTAGEIRIDDRVVNDVPPMDRDIAMVFQNYALYPHMSVASNLAFGLKMRKFEKAEIEKRINNAAGILGIESLLQRKPRQLSGGQRQRVALGRAIVRDPKVFLFDEPLSNLDAKLRVQMRVELKKLHERLAVTSVYVTHDQVEDAGRQGGGDEGRGGPAGRRAAGALQHAVQPFRGGLHRLAGHEFRRRDPGGKRRQARRRGARAQDRAAR